MDFMDFEVEGYWFEGAWVDADEWEAYLEDNPGYDGYEEWDLDEFIAEADAIVVDVTLPNDEHMFITIHGADSYDDLASLVDDAESYY